jgi:PAS domain S-box-containing protein
MCCQIWGENRTILDCNEAGVKLYGFIDKNEHNANYLKCWPEYQPDGQKSAVKGMELLERAFAGEACTFDWMHQMIDGTPIPTEVTLMRVEAGDAYFVISYTRDLRKLREAEERLKLMLDSNPLCSQIWDRNLKVLDCNEAGVRLYGFKDKKEYAERFIYECSPEFQPDGQRSDVKAVELVRLAFEGETQVFDWMHQKPDGTPIPAEVTLVRVDFGDDYLVMGYTRDLRKLREAEERLKLMLDSNPLCSQIWDRNLRVLDCNEAGVRLYGFKDKREYAERFIHECSPEYQPDGQLSDEKAVALVKKAFEGETLTFDWMHQKPDGTPIPAEVTLVRVDFGDDYLVMGYTRDLRKMREDEVRLRNMLDASMTAGVVED